MTTTLQLTAVGLSPGDPELVTMKRVREIQAVDLIFAEADVAGETTNG